MEQYTPIFDKTKIEIKIPNFIWVLNSNFFECEVEDVELKGYYPQTFQVWMSSGRNSDLQIEIFKRFHDETIDNEAFDEITWVFSIIDSNGSQKFIQSFTTEHIVNSPYEVVIPNFIKVSKLIDEAEELLPGDQLTVCCEVSFTSYPGKSLTNVSLYHLNQIRQNFGKNHPFDKVLETEKNLIFEMCNFLLHLDNLRNDRASLETLDLLKQKLLKKEKPDELMRTYMHENPCFQTYRRLERKLMKELEMWPSSNVERNLQPEFRVLWSNLKQNLKVKLECLFIEIDSEITPLEVLAQKLNRTIKKEETNDSIERKETNNTIEKEETSDTIQKEEKNYTEEKEANDKEEEEKENYRKDIESAIECLDSYFQGIFYYSTLFSNSVEDELKNDDENIGNLPECNNDNNHNSFIFKTNDGVIFTLPFQDSKELGSKLIEESKYFKCLTELSSNDIKGPVCLRENSREFLQVLRFLQEEPLHIKPFQLLCNAYETADKYMMEKMTKLCADLMKPLLSKANLNIVKNLARRHHCEHLKKIVQEFNKQEGEINFVN